MPDITQLQLVLHLAETLNYGRTAADCHVSAATLSRTVRRVETAVGAQLFERGPRGVALTEEGQRFCAYARSVVELWESYLTPDVATGPTLAGRLRVFASPTACQAIVPDLFAGFVAAHPQVALELRTGDAAAAMTQLEERAADVAVAALPSRLPAHLAVREVRRTPLVFVSSGATDDWRRGPFVLPRSGLARTAAERWFRQAGVRPRSVTEVDGYEALLTLVALGVGVGLVPELVLECSTLRDRLVRLRPRKSPGEFRIGLCVRRDDLHRPVVAALWASS